jgi:hypothetical protein
MEAFIETVFNLHTQLAESYHLKIVVIYMLEVRSYLKDNWLFFLLRLEYDMLWYLPCSFLCWRQYLRVYTDVQDAIYFLIVMFIAYCKLVQMQLMLGNVEIFGILTPVKVISSSDLFIRQYRDTTQSTITLPRI